MRKKIILTVVGVVCTIITALSTAIPVRSSLAWQVTSTPTNSSVYSCGKPVESPQTALKSTLTAVAQKPPTSQTQQIAPTSTPLVTLTASVTEIPTEAPLPANFVCWQEINDGNGHIYQLVEVPNGINWNDARAAAEESIFRDLHGHLATVTSESENKFLINSFGQKIVDKWLGGFQIAGSKEPAGGWKWVTDEKWEYSNWQKKFEPNEYEKGENALHFKWLNTGAKLGEWNDLRSTRTKFGSNVLNGYIVEYE